MERCWEYKQAAIRTSLSLWPFTLCTEHDGWPNLVWGLGEQDYLIPPTTPYINVTTTPSFGFNYKQGSMSAQRHKVYLFVVHDVHSRFAYNKCTSSWTKCMQASQRKYIIIMDTLTNIYLCVTFCLSKNGYISFIYCCWLTHYVLVEGTRNNAVSLSDMAAMYFHTLLAQILFWLKLFQEYGS